MTGKKQLEEYLKQKEFNNSIKQKEEKEKNLINGWVNDNPDYIEKMEKNKIEEMERIKQNEILLKKQNSSQLSLKQCYPFQ